MTTQNAFDDDVVIGEAVLVDIRTASFVMRALALVVDLLVMAAVGTAIGLLLVSTAGDSAADAAIGLAVTVAVLIGLPVTVETLTRGRSLGKVLAGLRVVRDDGGPIRARHALVRGLLALLEIYLTSGSVAMIVSLVNRRGKRLGDLLAGTYVIRERNTRPHPVLIRMPAPLATWAAGADIGRLPDRLALAARQFVIRAPSLAPAARERLARDLADQLRPRVQPAPPPGTPAEAYVAAVLSERTRRERERANRP